MMKKFSGMIVLITVLGMLLCILYFQFLPFNPTNDPMRGYEKIESNINGKRYNLIVADTPAKQIHGLMYVRKPIPGYDGMVFTYKDSVIRTFWNKNTFVNLKLLWLNKGTVVGESDLPSIETSKSIITVSSPEEADTVVELFQ